MRGSRSVCGSARIPTGVLATVTAVAALMLVPMAGQAQTVAAYTWTAPRTPWGDPDLQGQIRTTVGVMRTNRAFFTKLQYLFRY